MKFFVSAISLWFSVSLFADIIYETDYKENPTGATTSSKKGSFTTSMPNWGEGFSSAYLTSGSAGECTIAFSKPIDLTSYEDVQIIIQYGSASNRPLVININGTGDKTIHTMASSTERNIVITVSTDVAVKTLSSILVKSSGGGKVYFFHITITGTPLVDCPEDIVGDTTAYFFKGQSVTVWGETFSAETTRQKTYKTADGCDSIVTLHVKETTSGSITNASICEGKTYTWAANGKTYSQTTSASVVKKNKQGTDSICMLYLTVTPTIRTRETYNLTVGESYTWNGQTYTKAGDYTYTTSSRVTGCDSIVTLHLTQDTPTNITATICKGDTFYWYINGTLYNKYTTSKNTSTTQGGIKYYLNLTVQDASYQEYTYRLNLVQHEQYTWNGKKYSTPGIYFDTTEVYEDSGCPKKIEYLILNGDTAASTCDGIPFYWDRTGESTTSNTTKTYKFPTIKINGSSKYASISNKVTKSSSSTSITSATIFSGDSYTWFGKQYTKQGDYIDTVPNAAGCDSIGELHLGVCGNVPDTGYVRAVINQGDTYYWKYRNISYTSSTHDEFQFTNKYGCDSVAVLDLTVQPVPSGHEAATICEGDTYEWYGMTLSEPGTYTYGSHTLHLGMLPNPQLETCPDQVIHLGESTQLTVTGADYYSWEPLDYLSSEWSDQPVANPPVTTMYHVKSYNSAADNVVTNGDFELGNTGFTTQCTYETTSGVYGKYIISNDSYNMWSGSGHHTDHTSGSGNYMLIDGFATDNKVLWEQTVTVTPNTDYIFSAWFISLHTSIKYGSWAQLQFFVNDEPLGDVVESPHDGNSWGRYYELWDSKDNTTAKLTIKNQNINGDGNDFGIDDISFQALGPCFAEDSIKVTINFDIDLYDHCNHTIQTRNKDAQTHKVTYHVEGADCTDQVGYYKPEDQLTIRAHTTDPCVKFVRWSDGSTENPRIITMGDSDLTITPVFERAKYTIHVESNNGAVGEVDIVKP